MPEPIAEALEVLHAAGVQLRRSDAARWVIIYDERGKPRGRLKAPAQVARYVRPDGTIIDEATPEKQLRKMVFALLGVDLGVVPGERPTMMLCPDCVNAVYDVPKKGKVPARCPGCEIERYKCPEILPSGDKCGKTLNPKIWTPSSCAARNYAPPKCKSCTVRAACQKALASVTLEQRKVGGQKAQASKTPEQRRAAGKKAVAGKTPEQLRAAGKKAAASKTPEQRIAAAKKAAAARWANLIANAQRPEQLSAADLAASVK
jgi:hypothetical protein